MQILGSSDAGDFSRFGADVDNHGALNDGNEKVRALFNDFGENTAAQTVKHDGAFAAIDVVEALRDTKGGGGEDSAGAAEFLQSSFRHDKML